MEFIDVPAVVGAGHAGLAVVAELNARGIRPWLITADPPGATWDSRYDALRLNTQARPSSIPHHPTPQGLGRWPSATQWAQYLRKVAGELKAEQRRDTVLRVSRGADHWRIDLPSSIIGAQDVVVATGRHRVPSLPDWASRRDAGALRIQHASDFRRPDEFDGQRVLVVGGGNSGTEIAHLLVGRAASVSISLRSKPLFVRRELAGIGLTTAGAITRHVPDRLVSAGGRAVQRLAFGDLAPLGLGPPDHDLADLSKGSGPTVDSGFVDDVKTGRISVMPEVLGVRGATVRFRDQPEQAFDAVICATGYKTGLADLLEPAYLSADGQWPERPCELADDGLHFAGFEPPSLTSFLPDFATQAARIAAHIAQAVEARAVGSGHDATK